MNYKRRKPRTKVRCVMCTKYRSGNRKGQDNERPRDRRASQDRLDSQFHLC